MAEASESVGDATAGAEALEEVAVVIDAAQLQMALSAPERGAAQPPAEDDSEARLGFNGILHELRARYRQLLLKKPRSSYYLARGDKEKSAKQEFREMTYVFHGARLSKQKIEKLQRQQLGK